MAKLKQKVPTFLPVGDFVENTVSAFCGQPKPADFRTNLIYCQDCHSTTPAYDFSFDELYQLYADYRSPKYNQARISVEPGYARIAHSVGNDPREISSRNAAADAYLNRFSRIFTGGTMLDYGGSDGRFLPPSCFDRFERVDIFDPSKEPLHPSVPQNKVQRVSNADVGAYNFVSCLHVLEHVGSPLGFVEALVPYLKDDGLLYIETPMEMPEDIRQDFDNKVIDKMVGFHEHINKFYPGAVSKLVNAIPSIKLIDETIDVVDGGWCQFKAIRVLAQKKKS